MLYNMAQPQTAVKHHTTTHCLLPGWIGVRIGRVGVEKCWVQIKTVQQVKQKPHTSAKRRKEFFHPFPQTRCSVSSRKAGPHHT